MDGPEVDRPRQRKQATKTKSQDEKQRRQGGTAGNIEPLLTEIILISIAIKLKGAKKRDKLTIYRGKKKAKNFLYLKGKAGT